MPIFKKYCERELGAELWSLFLGDKNSYNTDMNF